MSETERSATTAVLESGPLVIVGRGRVGGSLAGAALAAHLPVVVVSHEAARAAAVGAGIVLLCVPDRAVGDVCAEIALADHLPAFLGHVSGASGLAVLAEARKRGVETFSLHPLQTIADPATDLAGAPCAISGSTTAAAALARALCTRLGMAPFEVPDDRRAAYHAAAVMASNYLIALEEAAADLLTRVGVAEARSVLAPMVLRAAANWASEGAAALTGPIARGDETIVQRHVEALRELAPELLPLYEALAERTRVAARRGGGSAPKLEPPGGGLDSAAPPGSEVSGRRNDEEGVS